MVCKLLGISRTAYYKAKAEPESSQREESIENRNLLKRIKEILQKNPEFGYRRVWARLRFGPNPVKVNKKRVQRLMQLNNLQAKVKRYNAPRKQHNGKVEVSYSNLLWGTDMTKIWCGKDGWASLFAVIDHCDREIVGYRFSLDAYAIRAREALNEAIIYRFGTPGEVPQDLELRSDNGSQFGAKVFVAEVERLGIKLTNTAYRCPQGNAIIERFFRTLKEECIWQHRFESFEEAERVITAWIKYYNEERMHSRLGYKSPKAFYEEQILRKNAA